MDNAQLYDGFSPFVFLIITATIQWGSRGALLMGLIQSLVMVTPPGATAEVRPWPGQATLLLGLMMIAAAVTTLAPWRNPVTTASCAVRPCT